MTSRFNVNVFMCEYADENVTNIKNICDTIKLPDNNKISFDLVTSINSLNYEEESFIFVYAIEKLNAGNKLNQVMVLSVDEIESQVIDEKSENTNQYGHVVKSSIPNSGQSTNVLHLKDVFFPEIGFYEIQVYMFLPKDIGEDVDLKKIDTEFLRKEHIVCTYGFEII